MKARGAALPLIGILPNVTDEGLSSVGLPYVRALEAAGGMPVMLPYTSDARILARFASLCDGFLFTGGCDVHPARFGEPISPLCGLISPPRDDVELSAFRHIYQTGKPILGICRGAQVINVALGGSLFQDIPSEIGGTVLHSRIQPSDDVPMHRIAISEDTPLCAIFGTSAVVNSYHHQAVKALGAGLCVMARAEDGVIEAAYAPAHPFLWAIQWHPERDPLSAPIFFAFLRAAHKDLAL